MTYMIHLPAEGGSKRLDVVHAGYHVPRLHRAHASKENQLTSVGNVWQRHPLERISETERLGSMHLVPGGIV